MNKKLIHLIGGCLIGLLIGAVLNPLTETISEPLPDAPFRWYLGGATYLGLDFKIIVVGLIVVPLACYIISRFTRLSHAALWGYLVGFVVSVLVRLFIIYTHV